MSVIFDNRTYRTGGVSSNIGYDINQLDLSGARLQVKFDYSSPVMESSTGGTSHVFTVTITDDILQKSKFLTVSTNGGYGTDVIDLEVKNIEFRILEHVRLNDSLFALKTYQMMKDGLDGTSSGVLVVSSKQAKPAISEEGEALVESDTGKVFYYDGAEWREFI